MARAALPNLLLLLQIAVLFPLLLRTKGINQQYGTVIVDAYTLRLQFDGSHRPPRDPNFPSGSLGRIGTAAACLQILPGAQTNDDADDPGKSTTQATGTPTTIWLGGRSMPQGSLKNSAEAEYEGLILCLEQAVLLFQSGQLRILPSNNATRGDDDDDGMARRISSILIQGDCRTVIDQMRDLSRPRKLQSQYRRAQECLGQLRQVGHRHSNGDSGGVPIQLTFQHIPREENSLCDGICHVIRSRVVEEEAWQSALKYCQQASSIVEGQSSILSRCIGPVNKSLIPYSKRPILYQYLAKNIRESNSICDEYRYQTLIDVGAQMEHEAKQIWSHVTRDNQQIPDGKNLQSQGVRLQIEGLRGLATRKSNKTAVATERQNRVLLERHTPTVASISSSSSSSSTASTMAGKPLREDEYLWETWLEHAKSSDEWHQEKHFWIPVQTIPGTLMA